MGLLAPSLCISVIADLLKRFSTISQQLCGRQPSQRESKPFLVAPPGVPGLLGETQGHPRKQLQSEWPQLLCPLLLNGPMVFVRDNDSGIRTIVSGQTLR